MTTCGLGTFNKGDAVDETRWWASESEVEEDSDRERSRLARLNSSILKFEIESF